MSVKDIQALIVPGRCLRLWCPFTTPPKEKYFLVTAIEPFLVQRGSDAEYHSADGLGTGGFRVQDAARGEYAEHTPHTHFTGVNVDADLPPYYPRS